MLTDHFPLTKSEPPVLANQHDFIITNFHGSDTPKTTLEKLLTSAY